MILLEMLHGESYGQELAQRADLWLQYGDWSFKGTRPTFEYSDLFPSDEQVQAAITKQRGGEFMLITQSVLKRVLTAEFDRGYALGRVEAEKLSTDPLCALQAVLVVADGDEYSQIVQNYDEVGANQ